MSEYLRASIKEVIDEVNIKYFLPDIQRPFVWKPEQIERLFDSLMRCYPISTFLFWKVEKETMKKYEIKKLKLVFNSETENDEDDSYNKDEYYLILDGQQRLTAFNLALKGTYIIRNKKNDLFFDLLSGTNEDEDGLLYQFEFDHDNDTISFQEEDNDKNGEIIPRSLWIKVKRVYDTITLRGYVEEKNSLLKEIKTKFNQLAEAEYNRIEINLDKLINALGAAKNISYFLEKEDDYNRVLDIFVRTNAGGTKLSYSDLLFSKIKLKWSEARANFNELISDLNQNEFEFDHDFLLKSFLVAFSKDSNQVRFKVENFKDEIVNKIKKDG